MAKKTKTEENKEKKQGKQTSPKVSNTQTQDKKYSDALKSEVFGSDQKDYQKVFQLRLFAPSTQIKIKDVISCFNGVQQSKSFFGLERLGKDLLAPFLSQEHQQSLAKQKTIKVNKQELKVEVFPPPAKKSEDLGNKYIVSKVPMTATGPGVAKALSPPTTNSFSL